MKRLLLLACALLVALGTGDMLAPTADLLAQTNPNPSGAAVVNQSGSRGDAAMACSSTVAATGTNTQTLVNPGAGLSDYVTYIGNWGAVSGSVVTATPTVLSSTGFNGTTPGWMPVNTATTATLVTGGLGGSAMVFNPPIKANGNTAPTLVVAAIAGITSIIQSCLYSSP